MALSFQIRKAVPGQTLAGHTAMEERQSIWKENSAVKQQGVMKEIKRPILARQQAIGSTEAGGGTGEQQAWQERRSPERQGKRLLHFLYREGIAQLPGRLAADSVHLFSQRRFMDDILPARNKKDGRRLKRSVQQGDGKKGWQQGFPERCSEFGVRHFYPAEVRGRAAFAARCSRIGVPSGSSRNPGLPGSELPKFGARARTWVKRQDSAHRVQK